VPTSVGRVLLTRRYSLPALHTLAGVGFSDEENRRVFGGCSRLHGHDYQVEVTVTGPVDPLSGLLIGRDRLDELVLDRLIDPLRGTNLSDRFKHTTGEALAVEFHRILSSQLPPPLRLRSVQVHETAKNSFRVLDEFPE
jgi:6-pyruvoyltetrahydropterin/6-carboxytetrahydropterin synthase